MIFIACKPFLCEGSIYIGGLETLLQKQQKATAKFERTDGIVGGREKADGTLTSQWHLWASLPHIVVPQDKTFLANEIPGN